VTNLKNEAKRGFVRRTRKDGKGIELTLRFEMDRKPGALVCGDSQVAEVISEEKFCTIMGINAERTIWFRIK